MMFEYGKTHMESYETLTDYKAIANISLEQMESTPFHAFNYINQEMKSHNKTMCEETDGDCYKYV